MNKQELISKISFETKDKNTKTNIEDIIDKIFITIKDVVMKGDEVKIRDFGTFSSKVRAARVSKNPKTGENVKVPEKRTPVFIVSKSFKDKLKEYSKKKKS